MSSGELDIKGLIHSHIEKLTPTFWLVPLRLYLGYMWLMSGLRKSYHGMA